ncbi:MAG: hypothetical protein AAFP67_05080 [Pseudomonadota bacterium]
MTRPLLNFMMSLLGALIGVMLGILLLWYPDIAVEAFTLLGRLGVNPANIIQVMILVAISYQAYLLYRSVDKDHERRREQATIEYIDRISRPVQDQQIKLRSKGLPLDGPIRLVDMDEQDRLCAFAILNILEGLATGANEDVFDTEIIEKLSGRFVISTFTRFKELIIEERNVPGCATFYTEYEALRNEVIELRRLRCGEVHIE